jgi:hypothetical protein
MLDAKDLARATVTRHALDRWRQRVGLPCEDLADVLRSAVNPPAHVRAIAWNWLTRGTRYSQRAAALRWCPLTGIVFLLKRMTDYADGSPCWAVVTVTTLDVVRENQPA